MTTLISNYRRILTHPHARLCYLGVLAEGSCIMGLYPYVAAFLQQLGEPRLSIAGLVIGGYAVGGLIYAAVIKRLLPLFGDNGLMVIGAILISSQIVDHRAWPALAAAVLQFHADGFWLLHAAWRLPGLHLGDRAGRTRQRGVAAGLHVQLRAIRRAAALWRGALEHRQGCRRCSRPLRSS